MSTQYGILIYGIPINHSVTRFFESLDPDSDSEAYFDIYSETERQELWEEWKYSETPFGLTKFYSSNDKVLGFLGVRLSSNLSTWEPVLLSQLSNLATVTEIQKKEVENKLALLPEILRKEVGQPSFWIVWGST